MKRTSEDQMKSVKNKSIWMKLFAYGAVIIASIFFLNFQDLSINENLWQYALIALALFGGLMNIIFEKRKDLALRMKMIVFIIVLASILLVVQIVYSLVNSTFELMLSSVSMVLLIIALGISLKDLKKSQKV